jgi:hypothetical protein
VPKQAEKIFLNRQVGTKVYTKSIMIMELKRQRDKEKYEYRVEVSDRFAAARKTSRRDIM